MEQIPLLIQPMDSIGLLLQPAVIQLLTKMEHIWRMVEPIQA